MLTGVLRASLIICFTLALSSATLAQDYPSRTIKIIVPTGAGGITDILARLVGKSISEQLGQPVIIDNRTGAGGTIGTRAVAQAEPDGYTLLMAFPSHAANPALYASLPYDSEKDFVPISMVTRVSEILLVPNSSPAKSVKDLIELARKQQLNYASVGVGSLAHLATELFLATAGVKMTHIPYRSVPQAQQAVMTGEVAAFFDTPVTALPQVRAGTVRRSASQPASGSRSRRIFRPSPKPACPVTKWWAGTACWPRPIRPGRSSTNSTRPSWRRSKPPKCRNCSASKASNRPATARRSLRGSCMPTSKNGSG
ncbi:MAG: hypothetical protein QOJ15_9854 [Bradyrhizobium sp.]|jgi:tripartite-type tricarboxylate transporter receptor subunit TctC|nr:hypothetical protein [Bradyrhizobium sp.]